MTRDYEILEEKLKTPKSTITGKELEDYTQNYRETERQKHNVEVEVRKLKMKNFKKKIENCITS